MNKEIEKIRIEVDIDDAWLSDILSKEEPALKNYIEALERKIINA